jgi:uncharacterized protein YbbC (DUF1343 family)
VDVGCRIYTYMLTLAGCLQAASRLKKRVVVLDRPNPLGLQNTEGNLLNLRWKSFVGWYEIPMRHGLTMGELGRYFLHCDNITCDYRVVEVQNLRRSTSLSHLSQMPWCMPSPNLPSWMSAFFFPSFVALETTNISEGRGSTTPFQMVGAPYFKATECKLFLENVCELEKFGIVAREHSFRPTFNKHAGKICRGLSFHITNFDKLEKFNLFEFGIWFLAHTIATSKASEFEWKAPGYEYNYTDAPVHLVLGHENWKELFDGIVGAGVSQKEQKKVHNLLQWAAEEANNFAEKSKAFHIYAEGF